MAQTIWPRAIFGAADAGFAGAALEPTSCPPLATRLSVTPAAPVRRKRCRKFETAGTETTGTQGAYSESGVALPALGIGTPKWSYYRARYYDPQAGRFLGEDPIRFNTGPNFYSYVRNYPTALIDPSGLAPCLNINAFVNELNNNAGDEPDPNQNCAQYVRWALEAGGINTKGHPVPAKNYGPFLQGHGFSIVFSDDYTPQPGDIAVIQPYTGGNQNGHIAGWNGSNWVSSFNQRGVYPGPGYRNAEPDYSIYRPTPCPPPNPPSSPPPPEQGLIQQILGWLGSSFGKVAWE